MLDRFSLEKCSRNQVRCRTLLGMCQFGYLLGFIVDNITPASCILTKGHTVVEVGEARYEGRQRGGRERSRKKVLL